MELLWAYKNTAPSQCLHQEGGFIPKGFGGPGVPSVGTGARPAGRGFGRGLALIGRLA